MALEFLKGTSGRFLIHLPLMSWHLVERVSRCGMMQRYFSFLGQPVPRQTATTAAEAHKIKFV